DDVGHANRHAVRQFLHCDRLGDDHFALDLIALTAAKHLGAAFFFLLLRTAISGERTHAIVIAGDFALDHIERQAAFTALGLAFLGWLDRDRRRRAAGLDAAAQITQQIRRFLTRLRRAGLRRSISGG